MGFFDRISEGLTRSRDKFKEQMNVLLDRGPDLDEEFWDGLEETLILADVGGAAAAEIVEGLRDQATRKALPDAYAVLDLLNDQIASTFTEGGEDVLGGQPALVLFVGINGTGKTTTVGKLAKEATDAGRTVILGSADTFRAAAIEQLEVWAERANVEVVTRERGSDPASVCYDTIERAESRGADLVLIDTAGRLHTSADLMRELEKVVNVVRKRSQLPVYTVLVTDATTGQNGLSQAREFDRALDLDGVIVTKLDGTAKGGIALAVSHELGLPVLKTDVLEVRVPFQNISTNDTNCYIVKDGDETLVIDTGAPSDEGFAILDAALTELDVDRTRMRFFLTHLHLDHAGLVDRLALPGAKLYVSPVDFESVRASRAASSYDAARRAFTAEGVPPSDASGSSRFATGPDLFDDRRFDVRFVEDGDVLHVGRFALQVVATPGHTPGHLSLFQPDAGILFGGDHVLFVISPSIALFPDGADGLQAYLDSLDKVRALRCEKLFVAHGEPRDDFDERIGWLRDHHLERLEETCGIVRDRPGLAGEEVIRAIKWNVPYPTWEEISFVQRWCIVTEGVVILNHLVGSGAIRREKDESGINRYF